MSCNFLQAFWRLTFGVLYKHWLASVLMEQDFADPWVVLEPHCCTAQETENNMCTWLARVPTEANIADYPSRNMPHVLLEPKVDESTAAVLWFQKLLSNLRMGPT